MAEDKSALRERQSGETPRAPTRHHRSVAGKRAGSAPPAACPEGRFRRLRCLGAGGMGVVYEAVDRLRGERVAIKAPARHDPGAFYQLKREFRRLAGIRHRNLVRLHDLIVDGADVFISMELIEGVDFVTFCRSSSDAAGCDAKRARGALRQLYDGLRELHAQGLVHRDLKPGNVLVDGAGRVVIIDFGLTTVLGRDEDLTLGEAVAGTTAYMAPELAHGGSKARPAADWYAVGVMLFEVLAGRRPFANSMAPVLGHEPRADAADVFAGSPAAPRDLGELCNALLHPDPTRRADATQVARVLAVAPTLASRPRAAQRPSAWRAELAALRREVAAAARGERRVAVVCGPARSGKTALLDRFVRSVEAGSERALVLRGACHPRERIPYRALDPLLDQLCEFWRRLTPREAMYLLPRQPELLLQAFPVLARVDELRDAARPELVKGPGRVQRVCSEVLERLARRRILVLVIDDAHWLDAESAGVLRVLLGSEARSPVSLVLARSATVASATARRQLALLERTARYIALERPGRPGRDEKADP